MQGDKGRGWCNNLISNRKLQKPEAKCQAPSNYMEGAWHFALINFSSPWLIQEIEPNAAAVIGTFGIKTEALMDVIRGKFNPTGKLPLTIPAIRKQLQTKKGMYQALMKLLPMYTGQNQGTSMVMVLDYPIIWRTRKQSPTESVNS
ncbi:hypothetical protein J2Y03_000842 [Neobacillus niacini]|uniref:hypothetical protein n=1 Tax=Neobacillus niacini TaxID=86668 RepID=UPI00285AE0EE|nr:hypothetical protein [Neobacillus niacini]MDR7075854.1 hypothetical protein [Neobacillus niacini]